MNYQSRRLTTKRKEVEPYHPSTLPKPPTSVSRAVKSRKGADQPPSSNLLLAGYMAYEFLTEGTLFGQKFDPSRAEALPVGPSKEAEPNGNTKPKRYAEVANLLKSDGAHIPGVVNPTQLAQWIQM